MDTNSNLIRSRSELCDKIFGEEADASDDTLSRIVYKATNCGGWCRTDRDGVEIGTIVEGSDAEFSDYLAYPFTQERWDAAWDEIEAEADRQWKISNMAQNYTVVLKDGRTMEVDLESDCNHVASSDDGAAWVDYDGNSTSVVEITDEFGESVEWKDFVEAAEAWTNQNNSNLF